MAVVSPFKAFHYNTKKISDLSQVITPPYDVIPAGMDQTYWQRSPYNFAHLDLPHGPNETYQRANELLGKWMEHSILVRDNAPGYYLYRQTFQANGVKHMRDTLMAAVLLHDFADGIIRPHENTYGQYKTDRLQLMKATGCQLSHIFGMVKDPEGFLEGLYEKWEFQTPLLHGRGDDGVENTVWKIDGGKGTEIATFFADKPLYILDGHHRYESSVQYAREKGVLGNAKDPAAYMMFAIANSFDPALVVFPTHREVRSLPEGVSFSRAALEEVFQLAPLTEEELRTFVTHPDPTPRFALAIGRDLYLCTPRRWQSEEAKVGKSISRLAVFWSDQKLLQDLGGIAEANRKEHISYEKDLDAALEKRAEARLVIYHAPPAVEAITQIADEKKFMPQKSTYFYPKLAAGMIMRDLKG
jgi:uncharacterized protein (DUF1015 family)